MGLNLNPTGNPPNSQGSACGALMPDLDKQRLRILRCTAEAMANSPGGLRFKAGTRPWLEGLSGIAIGRGANAVAPSPAD